MFSAVGRRARGRSSRNSADVLRRFRRNHPAAVPLAEIEELDRAAAGVGGVASVASGTAGRRAIR
jgi:hypothetical protein